jgi:DNA-binding MltR family transcriptional regulator
VKIRKLKNDDEKARFADSIIFGAAQTLHKEADVPLAMILDRVLTFAAAQIVRDVGPVRAAEIFGALADNIRGGALDAIAYGRTGSTTQH